MGKIKITLTDELLKLISNINVHKFDEFGTIGVDFENLYGESDYKYDDMAIILGFYHTHRISKFGQITYPEDKINLMDELDKYIIDNFQYITDIIFKNIIGGLKIGVYSKKNYMNIWEFTTN
jgi:hypothetical protein